MYNSTRFDKKNGGTSSIRSTIKYGNGKKMSINTNTMSGKSMVTFSNRGMTTRLNNSGKSITTGLSSGGKTTYFGSGLSVKSDLGSIK
ncbi:hypothetical protein [Peptacetobacter hiranonis]|uniref:hypothetical protein n=1 Tax=Peptacetobacter hiranonis TaxID=89152 RepID=UPI002E788150|nr:hypothetical protein [Peptacetobacter hiranonis]MEE0248408.1 hypothetical protein [Peptacetobacter hiranonis]